MLIIAYILLFAGILLHAGYWLQNLFGKSKAAWNYNKHVLVVLSMLLLIAGTNAVSVLTPSLAPRENVILRLLFGQGQTKGILLLGIGGIYWGAVFLYSMAMRLKYPLSKDLNHVETMKLPPGGLLTLWVSMALVIFLLGLIVWGTT